MLQITEYFGRWYTWCTRKYQNTIFLRRILGVWSIRPSAPIVLQKILTDCPTSESWGKLLSREDGNEVLKVLAIFREYIAEYSQYFSVQCSGYSEFCKYFGLWHCGYYCLYSGFSIIIAHTPSTRSVSVATTTAILWYLSTKRTRCSKYLGASVYDITALRKTLVVSCQETYPPISSFSYRHHPEYRLPLSSSPNVGIYICKLCRTVSVWTRFGLMHS